MLDKAIYKDENIVENRRLQMLAAGLKAYSTWESVDTLQACREATGGMVRNQSYYISLSTEPIIIGYWYYVGIHICKASNS